MAIYFGAQSLSGYAIMGWLAQLFRDAGYRPETAGLLLAGVTALGVPIALLMPTLAGRLAHPAPAGARADRRVDGWPTWGWRSRRTARRCSGWLLLAIGQGAFPLILTTIGLRARTADGTVALSAFAQSTGYVIAALGPLLVGILYEVDRRLDRADRLPAGRARRADDGGHGDRSSPLRRGRALSDNGQEEAGVGSPATASSTVG